MTTDKIGVDKTMITYDKHLTLSIEAIAKELYETLTGKRMQSGGKYKTKRRLTRRSNRRSNIKHNIKHNTKTKKRIQNRYRRYY
jgi:hypothetical protein